MKHAPHGEADKETSDPVKVREWVAPLAFGFDRAGAADCFGCEVFSKEGRVRRVSDAYTKTGKGGELFMLGHDLIVVGASAAGVDALPLLIANLPGFYGDRLRCRCAR